MDKKGFPGPGCEQDCLKEGLSGWGRPEASGISFSSSHSGGWDRIAGAGHRNLPLFQLEGKCHKCYPSGIRAQALPYPTPVGLVRRAFSELLSPGSPNRQAPSSLKADHWHGCTEQGLGVSKAGLE